MKNKIRIHLIAIFLLLSTQMLAANNDTILAKVYYKCFHLYDTTLNNAARNENMILFVGREYSLYKSLDKMYNDSIIEDGSKKGKDMLDYRTNGTRLNTTNNQLIKKNKEPYIVYENMEIIRNYLIRDNIEGLQKWQITTETKKIETLTATKATCTFRGRNYEAWFCPDIPIQNGPWKFGGLPGLILELSDSKNQVKFTFLGMEKTSDKNLPMPVPPSKTITTTLAEFEKIKEAKRNDPIGWVNAALEETGSPNRIEAINGQTQNVKQPNRTNNPIELNFEVKLK